MSRGLTATVLVCVAAAGVAVGALTLDGGGGGGEDATGTRAGPAGDGTSPTLVIDGFAFSATTAVPGQTVTVDNRDEAPHTVTAADGSFDTDTVDAAGSSSFVTPTTPGTYQFGCSIHPEMSGTLTVQATGTGSNQTGQTTESPTTDQTGEIEETPGY